MSKPPELSFEEFRQMCEDAGIAGTPEELEQDFRIGTVMADLVDQIHTSMEESPAPYANLAQGVTALEDEMDTLMDAAEAGDGAAVRKSVLILAAKAARFAAEVCHDEVGNN